MTLLLKNGNIIDAKTKREGVFDIFISDGVIREVAPDIFMPADKVIDCTGLYIFPGLCDIHVHLRDPGQTHKEDIFTGGEAAAAGGVTAVVCMPNTSPVIDNPETVHYIIDKSKSAKVKVYPVGTITKNLAGTELSDYEALKKAGIVAVSDDGRPVANTKIMAEAMVKAWGQNLLTISHCEDLDIINGGIINDGETSKKLGVKGMHRSSENTITAREILLANDYNVPIHIAHVSTKECVEIIRAAKNLGVKVTCETAPHYFLLTDKLLLTRDANYRMNPPLREQADVEAITRGLIEGIIDCIVTDHAPHAAHEKADFEKAPNGVVGLETSLAATLTALYHTEKLNLMQIVQLMCVKPREILNIEGGSLSEGDIADIAIVDINEEWTVIPEKLRSKSKNTCFKGMKFKGKVKYTILNGNIIFSDKN